jgi:hypothetical protein
MLNYLKENASWIVVILWFAGIGLLAAYLV